MRYGTCRIDSRTLFSLSSCEFKDSPIRVPGSPSYGLVANSLGEPRLYSARDIGRDEIISQHPVQVVPPGEMLFLRGAGLEELCFQWDCDQPDSYAVALGAGAFLGHSSEPNCCWQANYSNTTVCIYPRRPIFAGEELTIDYFTDRHHPAAALSRSEVKRLSAEQLPQPEAPKAVVTSDLSYGRTLVAVRDVLAGENIAEAPVRVIARRKSADFEEVLSLVDLAYTWEKWLSAVVLGLPSLVNHSYAANAFYQAKPGRRTISLVAYKDIPAGCEITMNYNGHPNDKSPLDWESTERDNPLMVPLVREDCHQLVA